MKTSKWPNLKDWGWNRNLLRSRDGTMTSELHQEPGAFGLGKVPQRLKPDQTSTSICGFCSTGCSLTVHLQETKPVNLTPSRDYPVNLGMACPKGWEALTPLAAPDRAVTPLLRNAAGQLEPVEWPEAVETFCHRFKAIQEKHGPQSVAWLGTGQIMVEEMAFLGALGKFGMGMRHGDGNTRQCMATSVAAYKESFGFDAPPFTYADFEESDVLVFIGANPCLAHPILWERVLRNQNNPEIIVIDPRKTETAASASQHLGLIPKTDLVLLYGVAHQLISRNQVCRDYIEQHTEGFEAFKKFVEPYSLSHVTVTTGLAEAQIVHLVKTIASGQAVSFWWTMGVNQSHQATRTAQAIINLALMTGNMGRPGTGANSITGQCNAMGSRLFSNTTNLLGGHDFQNPVHRKKIADILEIDAALIPDENSLAYDQILKGVDRGAIRGLWIVATNPSHSWIDKKGLPEVFKKLDFLVVQDMYATTETASHADMVLPAAGWGEKEGTFINSERRFGVCHKVSRPPGQALSDFQIFRLIADGWGCGHLFKKWASPEGVFQILKQCSRGQPADITGIADYEMLDLAGGIQWPWPDNPEEGQLLPEQERRLFADGRYHTPNGKARFVFDRPQPNPEIPDDRYPLWLLTGRGSSAQWHTNTRTGKSSILKQLYPEQAYVEIHPSDAWASNVNAQEKVRITSRRAEVIAVAVLNPNLRPGTVFMPMHYAETNQLTKAIFDPHSRQPSYKSGAVRLSALKE